MPLPEQARFTVPFTAPETLGEHQHNWRAVDKAMNTLPFFRPGYVQVAADEPLVDLIADGFDADISVGRIERWDKTLSWTRVRVDHAFNIVGVSEITSAQVLLYCDIASLSGTYTRRHFVGGVTILFPGAGNGAAQFTIASSYIDSVEFPLIPIPKDTYSVEFFTQITDPSAVPVIFEVNRTQNSSAWYSIEEIPYG